MNASVKLGLYALAVAVVFAGSFAVGTAAEPVGLSNAEPPAEHGGMAEMGDGLPGLVNASAATGLTLQPATAVLPANAPTRYEFTVVGKDGRPLTEFELSHTKPMHMIVVRRDFTGFIHEHPVMAADGTWSTTLNLPAAGAYRVFADFAVDGDKHTLGADLFVPGPFQPAPLPAPADTADAGDGYEVRLTGQPTAGEPTELEFTVFRNGQPVTDIADYLGAKGHLVALRDGDLAYLHVHADEERLHFEADFPTPGAYRLFLQFDVGGQLRTVAFTVNAVNAAKEANR